MCNFSYGVWTMVIFRNIIGFDGLIFILAGVNIYIMIMARKAANDLYESMHQRIYAPAVLNDLSSVHEGMTELTDQKISTLREAAVSKYTLYINLTAIFPLMGILGTVISLLGMVGDTSDIEGGFFAALTSTFWGLVFAITFKFLDGFISPKLEDGEHAADLFMQRKTDDIKFENIGSKTGNQKTSSIPRSNPVTTSGSTEDRLNRYKKRSDNDPAPTDKNTNDMIPAATQTAVAPVVPVQVTVTTAKPEKAPAPETPAPFNEWKQKKHRRDVIEAEDYMSGKE